jgi:hypothetical protein
MELIHHSFFALPKERIKETLALALRNSVVLLKPESLSDFSTPFRTSSALSSFQFAPLFFADAMRKPSSYFELLLI